MSRPDDKYTDMEVAFIDEWTKQGKSVRDLTYADAIKFGYEQAMKKAEDYVVSIKPKGSALWEFLIRKEFREAVQ